MRILAISGSLRRESINSRALRVLARLAAESQIAEVNLFNGLGNLPLFNPDLEDSYPQGVNELKNRICEADALIIASPEYAHGISGPMKNALDWMVGNESFVNKPVALLNTSPRASHAIASLREVLCTMSARLINTASISLPLLGKQLDDDALFRNEVYSGLLQGCLEELVKETISATNRNF